MNNGWKSWTTTEIRIKKKPYRKDDIDLIGDQTFLDDGKLREAQKAYEQRAKEREKMGLEDKDSAEAWRCPKEQEL